MSEVKVALRHDMRRRQGIGWLRRAGLVSSVLLLAACTSLLTGTYCKRTLAQLRDKPASWQGEMACPGCAERWVTLTLFPDGTYRLRERYTARRGVAQTDFHDRGRWAMSPRLPDHFQLTGANAQPLLFKHRDDGSLRLQATDGGDIRSIRDYVLKPLSTPDPISESMLLLGLVTWTGAEGLRYQECLTGVSWPVAPGPQHEALRRQLAALPPERQSRPVPASLFAHFAGQPGHAHLPGQLVIDRQGPLWPGETCDQGRQAPLMPLEETGWQLVELEGRALPALGVLQVPRLRLRDGRLQGFAGCNRISASYVRQGDQIQVSGISSTRMACAADAQHREQQVLRQLRQPRVWRVSGGQLEWQDDGQVQARWQAGDMP